MPKDIYWKHIRKLAKDLGADGCTMVSELYHECCLEHDVHYRTGWRWKVAYTKDGDIFRAVEPITRAEADEKFRKCIQSRSYFGSWSPIAFIRWAGCRCFGWYAWKH